MQILQSTQSQPDYIPPPPLAPDQAVCGPEYPDRSAGGRVLSLKTALGQYDIAEVAARLPPAQRPDLAVVRTDSTRRNRPVNIAGLGCPAVLVVGDTHHAGSAIASAVEYALAEPFAAVILDYTRQHAHFFIEAGLARVYWLPGFNVHRFPRPPAARPDMQLSFVGQFGQHHPRRRAMLEALQKAGLPLQAGPAPRPQARYIHARSVVSLNCSLNGDLNLRVFEVMMSGGCLLTDRLGAQSGLELLFQDGSHLAYYDGATQCVEQARYLLRNPARAAAIGEAGRLEYESQLAPERIARDFIALVDKGVVRPEFDLAKDGRARVAAVSGRDRLMRRIAIYELIQGAQLRQEKTSVVATPGVEGHLLSDLADFARVSVSVDTSEAGPEIEALTAFLADAGVARQVQLARNPGGSRGDGQTIVLTTGAEWRRHRPARDALADAGAPVIIADLESDPGAASELEAAGLQRLAPHAPVFARPS